MDRYEQIILATLDLAAQNGLGSVSLAQIAEKVGIKKPSLYNHFKSKEDLVQQMYVYLRKKAMQTVDQTPPDLEKLVKDRSAEVILKEAVHNYQKMNQNPEMLMFYKVIYSERAFHAEAADIVAQETKRMILSTKSLFYALQSYKILDFNDIDIAAESFAMTIHSILDYEMDLKNCTSCSDPATQSDFKDRSQCNSTEAQQMLDRYIQWFCRLFESGR